MFLPEIKNNVWIWYQSKHARHSQLAFSKWFPVIIRNYLLSYLFVGFRHSISRTCSDLGSICAIFLSLSNLTIMPSICNYIINNTEFSVYKAKWSIVSTLALFSILVQSGVYRNWVSFLPFVLPFIRTSLLPLYRRVPSLIRYSI